MAEIIIQQYGKTCNGVAYASVSEARQAAQALLDGLGLNEYNSTDIVFDAGTWVGVGWTDRQTWIVTGANPVNQALVTMRCATRTEAVLRARQFGRLIAEDLVRDAFEEVTGKPAGRQSDHLLYRRSTIEGRVTQLRLRQPSDA
nr:MAG TPA: hypothetical protein [Caudoviricetes sp.]